MKGYILNLYTKEKIEFKDDTGLEVYLNDLTENKEANYDIEEVIGRSEGYAVYANSSNKTVSFTLEFYFNDPNKTKQIKEKFEELLYPAKTGNIFMPPPVILLVWGKWLKIRGVVKSFSATPQNRWNKSVGLPYAVDINLEIMEVNENPKYFRV